MKRSLLACVGLMALALCSAVVVSMREAAMYVVDATLRVKAYAAKVFGDVMRTAPTKAGELHREPMQRLTQAKQFVLRFIKREAPVIESRWRACPST